MTSKAQRRSRKRSRTISLAGGETVPQRATGRDRTHTNQPQEDARLVALESRMRKVKTLTEREVAALSKKLADARNIEDIGARARAIDDLKKHVQNLRTSRVSDACMGTDMGLCINKLTGGDTRAQIIDAWGAISASRRNYRLRYIGQSGEPKGATIAMVPDATETDPSLRVDIRSPDERADQAKASWAAWEAKINALPLPQLKWAIRGALDGFMGEASLWRNQAPTPLGTVAVEALRRMADG